MGYEDKRIEKGTLRNNIKDGKIVAELDYNSVLGINVSDKGMVEELTYAFPASSNKLNTTAFSIWSGVTILLITDNKFKMKTILQILLERFVKNHGRGATFTDANVRYSLNYIKGAGFILQITP